MAASDGCTEVYDTRENLMFLKWPRRRAARRAAATREAAAAGAIRPPGEKKRPIMRPRPYKVVKKPPKS